MAINVYTVLSEFRFDVGNAVTSSELLQSKVQQVSDTVQQAKGELQSLGVGFLSQLSGYSAGILGLFGGALKASDKFSQSQLSFTTIIDSNLANLTGSVGTLNEQLMASKTIMNDIAKDSQEFGISADSLKAMTEGLSAILVPKGLAGDNFANARTMSRNLLKSAPNLGLDPVAVQGQLIRAISGDAAMSDTLFRRLLAEAPEPFRDAKVKDAKDFNALAKKDLGATFDILNKALGKFASNAKILEARANTLSGTMIRVRDLFGSFNSVLKPLGDVLVPFVVKVLNMAIAWIDTKGRELVKVMSNFIGKFLDDPKKLLHEVDALADLGANVKNAGKLAMLAVGVMHIQEAFHLLGKIPFMKTAMDMVKGLPFFSMFMNGMKYLFIGMAGALKLLWPLFKIAIWGFVEMSAGLMAFLIPLQGLSKALSRMKIESVEWMATNAVTIAELTTTMADVFRIITMPIQDMITGFEELFFSILGGTSVLDGILQIFNGTTIELKSFAEAFLEFYASLRGTIAGTFDVFYKFFENIGMIAKNLMSGNISGMMDGTKNIFSGYMEAGGEEFLKTLDRGFSPTTSADGVSNARVSNHNHNYDVKMTNNFKEVLQPDRIAFTIKDQLEKASVNRTQAQASTLSRGMAL